jgi:hypothetical protein
METMFNWIGTAMQGFNNPPGAGELVFQLADTLPWCIGRNSSTGKYYVSRGINSWILPARVEERAMPFSVFTNKELRNLATSPEMDS